MGGSVELDDLHMVIVGGMLNFSVSFSFLLELFDALSVPFSVLSPTTFFELPFFADSFVASFELSDIEASEASAASAADASAPKGSFITSFGVMYIRS